MRSSGVYNDTHGAAYVNTRDRNIVASDADGVGLLNASSG